MAFKFNSDSFFNMTKPLEKISVSGPEIGGVLITNTKENTNDDDDIDEEDNPGECSNFQYMDVEYAHQFQELDDEKTLKIASIENDTINTNSLQDIEDFTTVTYTGENFSAFNDTALQVYRQYNFSYNAQDDLPINYQRENIINMIETNQVLIIEGATGCGKSTQVPQFILDNCKEQNVPCNIIVTQPRRIAAISIARRVAEQRKWRLGTVVGFQVGLMREVTEETILTFVTTGVLLQKLISAQNLNEYTHIILDEVHERDKDMDFLMLVVRKFLRTNSRNVKVILMSATFDATKFSEYFSTPVYGKLVPAQILSVDRYSKYRTQIFYLEELSELGPIPELSDDKQPYISKDLYHICAQLIKVFDNLEKHDNSDPGSVLVFLPGIHEIEEMDTILRLPKYKANVNYEILPLHSTITMNEQKRVFKLPQKDCRKIILSTNIAESSITVPDIKYVIDFCLTKTLIYDPKTSYSSLQLNWTAKNNCKQRSGRTGRVADGRVYRLVPKVFYEDNINEENEPEMLRCPLDILVLLTKRLNLGLPPHEILALAIDPPGLSQIEKTILILKEVGALLKTHDGIYSKLDGDMTYFGHVMASLPLDIRVSKMIILGHLFGVLEDTIIMAAGMSTKNVFSTPFKEEMKTYNSKLIWADGTCSDLIALLNVYKVWRYHTKENLTLNTADAIREWGRRHYLQTRVLKEIDELIDEIKRRLYTFNITEYSEIKWNDVEKPLILKIVICGAFYPNYFVRLPNRLDEREAFKTLNGHEPNNTVYFQGLDKNQPGQLYINAIKNELKSCGTDMTVSFDSSSKVFVTFNRKENPKLIREGRHEYMGIMPGNVALEVYRAVRFKQLYKKISIPILPANEAQKKAKELGLYSTHMHSDPWCTALLPGIEVSIIPIKISHVINPGHFWSQYVGYKYDEELEKINKMLNIRLMGIREAVIDQLYAAPFEGGYYRARCDAIYLHQGHKYVEVFYVDYGNKARILESELRIIPPNLRNIPAQAFECVLCKLKPSLLLNSRSVWTDKAFSLFQKIINRNHLLGQIYSVNAGVVSLELFITNENVPMDIGQFGHPIPRFNRNVVQDESINEILLNYGFAQPAEESYSSKCNHEMRESQLNLEVEQRLSYNLQQQKSAVKLNNISKDVESPKPSECRRQMTLKGPHSPLEARVYSTNLKHVDSNGILFSSGSVNVVYLDSELQDPHERLVIAAGVSISQTSQNLTLYNTTIMPNIPGFPVLMAILFCPTMELQTNSDGTNYTNLLCGLGYDPNTNKSLFREHDLLLNIDVEITPNDINLINCLRYFINAALIMENDEPRPYSDPDNFAKCQKNIQEKLLELLKIKRKLLENVEYVSRAKWNQYNEATLLKPDNYGTSVFAVYPLHSCIDLSAEQETIKYKKNIKHLLNISTKVDPFPRDGAQCIICDITVLNIDNLRIHLISTLHTSNCKRIGLNEKTDD